MNCHRSRGFALPTVLIASIIMLTVLMASIVSMSATRSSLLGQYYNQLSQEAADAGLRYAQSCLDANGGIPQWNDARPLTPGKSCSGIPLTGNTCPENSIDEQCVVMINGNIKSSFRVGLPNLNSDGKAVDLSSSGIVSLIKTSDGSIWRTYSQSSKTKIIATGIVADNLVLNLDASNPKSYSGGGTAWTDLSGNNNNGVLMNGVSYSNADGGSLVFDGLDDYVNLGTNASLDTGDNVTISAWIKPAILSGGRYVIYSNRNSNQTGSSQLEIGTIDGSINTAYVTVPGIFTAKASNNAMTINNWQYVVYTRIGSLQSIYINGINATKSVISATFSNNNSHKTIGVGSLTSPCYFKGQISSVQIYSRGLSSEEIKQNYKAVAGKYNLRSIQTLIVGGGGSGASSNANVGGGGGGGGGYIFSDNLNISAGSYNVVVGNGSATNANNATASSFANLTAAAGASGGGAPCNLGIGLSGAASGGGSASATTAAGSDLSGQYHNGALGFGTFGSTITSGGGGGGAGGAGGAAASYSAGGAGGPGVANSISGVSVIYASGGAGGVGSGGTAGASAAANTGRGGTGGGGNLSGGAGGSGVVIIKYLTGLYSATGGTITTSGNYTIHTFTSNGTFTIN